ncbi:MAG: glycosyltransferase family 2 protein [Betaproteobacteria bacterium]
MKLVVQIPCFDEEKTLGATVADLPTTVAGVREIALVVVDDGSADRTASVAESLGAVTNRLPARRGLARAFMAGIETSLALGADVIVNTDGDNQYVGADIARLVEPIVAGRADVVIGARPIAEIAEFSAAKKLLQRVGSSVVRRLAGVYVADATSGFRAYSREAALRLNVFSRYTYTLETIVQAGQGGMRILSVPIGVNRVERPSRLSRGTGDYVVRAGIDLARMFVVYRPFRFFAIPAALSIVAGAALVARFVALFVQSGGASGHVQSLIAATILLGIGGALIVVALLGDLIAINRRLLEDVRLADRRERLRPGRSTAQRAAGPA